MLSALLLLINYLESMTYILFLKLNFIASYKLCSCGFNRSLVYVLIYVYLECYNVAKC